MELTDTLSLAGGILLSILFRWLPGLRNWYGQLDSGVKSGVMAGAVIAIGLALYRLSCAGWLEGLWPGLSVSCSQAGLQQIIRAVALVLVGNQSTYSIIRKFGNEKAQG